MHSVSWPKPPIDKPQELRVSIAIGAAILAQSAIALIWTGAASERLSQLERRADDNAELIERTTRLEEQALFMRASLQRIETKLDRPVEEHAQ